MANFQYERVSFKANIIEWTGRNTAEILALYDDAELIADNYILVREQGDVIRDAKGNPVIDNITEKEKREPGQIYHLKKGDCVRVGENGSRKKKSWKECQLTYRKVKARIPVAYLSPDGKTACAINSFNIGLFNNFDGWTPLYK